MIPFITGTILESVYKDDNISVLKKLQSIQY